MSVYLFHDPEVCSHGVRHPGEQAELRNETDEFLDGLLAQGFLGGSVDQQGLVGVPDVDPVLAFVVVQVGQLLPFLVDEGALRRRLEVNVVHLVALVVVPRSN